MSNITDKVDQIAALLKSVVDKAPEQADAILKSITSQIGSFVATSVKEIDEVIDHTQATIDKYLG